MDRTDRRRSFGPAAIVAISPCGDWWVYPWAMRLTRVHDLLQFHAAAACKVCVSRTDAPPATWVRPPSGRVN